MIAGLLSQDLAPLALLMLICGLVSLWWLWRGALDTLVAARQLLRQLRGAPMPAPRLSDAVPLLLPPGVRDLPQIARPTLGFRLAVLGLIVVLLPALAWHFDLLFSAQAPNPLGITLFALSGMGLIWGLVECWTWRADYDAVGMACGSAWVARRRRAWRDLVLITGDGPLARQFHWVDGDTQMVPRYLANGERLYQMAESHLFRTPADARAARG